MPAGLATDEVPEYGSSVHTVGIERLWHCPLAG